MRYNDFHYKSIQLTKILGIVWEILDLKGDFQG